MSSNSWKDALLEIGHRVGIVFRPITPEQLQRPDASTGMDVVIAMGRKVCNYRGGRLDMNLLNQDRLDDYWEGESGKSDQKGLVALMCKDKNGKCMKTAPKAVLGWITWSAFHPNTLQHATQEELHLVDGNLRKLAGSSIESSRLAEINYLCSIKGSKPAADLLLAWALADIEESTRYRVAILEVGTPSSGLVSFYSRWGFSPTRIVYNNQKSVNVEDVNGVELFMMANKGIGKSRKMVTDKLLNAIVIPEIVKRLGLKDNRKGSRKGKAKTS